MVEVNGYEFQGTYAIIISLIFGLIGRYVLDYDKPLYSFKVSMAVVLVKTACLILFILLQLWLSFGLTSCMLLLWSIRARRFYVKYKTDLQKDSLLSDNTNMSESLII
jgi:hypothetical protein